MICTFRGVPFLPVEESATSGRRVQVSEFPGIDTPLSVDLGRSARHYKIVGALNGDNPIEQLNPLLSALEQPGPGTLIHPTLGVLSVVVVSYETTMGAGDDRTVTITMDLVESGEAPEPQTDPVAKVTDAAAQVAENAGEWYESALDLVGGIAATRTAVASAAADLRALTTDGPFASTIDEIEALSNALDDIDGSLVALVNAPSDYAAALVACYESVTDWRVLNLLLEPWGTETPALTGTPSTNQQRERDNTEAVRALNARMALSSAALGLSSAARGETFASRNAALLALDTLTAALDAEIETADPINAASLLSLRDSIIADVIQSSLSLPEIEAVEVDTIADMVTLVHGRFGSLDRLDAHLTINDFPNPLFVTGTVYLEVPQ